jgi:cation diffusion facilitator family transporter
MSAVKVQGNSNKKLAYTQGWISIFVNGLLFIFKYWAGFVTGSLALMADAWHTMSDSLSSVIVLIGTKISSKPPDDEHPFGHGRAELIAAVIIGVILLLIGFEFAKDSILRLINHESVVFGKFALWVTVASVVVKESLAQFSFWACKKTGNPSLKADGWHHRSDAISSLIILVGILVGEYLWWIDGVLGLVVSLLIFYASYEIIREGTDPLLGEIPERELISQLEAIAKESTGMNTHLHHVHVHRYGEHIELTAHIRLPKNTTLEKAHQIADDIEMEISQKLNIEATIHMEPI